MTVKSLLTAMCLSALVFGAQAGDINLNNGKRFQSDLKRDPTSKPVEVIRFSGISEGMVVADIFGGGGYYSELLSQVVGDKGKVYLHNNNAYLKFIGPELKSRVANNRLPNVVNLQREAEDLDFKANSLDAVFFVLGYHDLYHKSQSWDVDKEKFLAQLSKALKKGGLLLVVDHAAPEGSGTKYSQKIHRIEEAYVKQELESKGFKFIKDAQMLRNSKDSRVISPFRPEIRRKTDRFVMLFRKV